MVNRPSQPEIITVNSEALQQQIRDLLPSQNGFGSELQASNVITPIIDLTATAEGSALPTYLQTSLAFGSQTTFSINDASLDLANAPGFYRVTCISSVDQRTTNTLNKFTISDGVANKDVYEHNIGSTFAGGFDSVSIDLIFFLRAGDTLTVSSNNTGARIAGSIRQVATGSGELVPPNGFPL